MANEINIQASVTYQRYSPSAIQGAGALDVNQATTSNKASISNVQLVGTAAEQLQLGDVNTGPTTSEGLFYLFVKNLGPTNYLELSTDNFTKIFAKLRVNEFCLVPVSQTYNQAALVYARANTAQVEALVVAVSP
jgi:hypothetical protein